jgi:hypothetical protein
MVVSLKLTVAERSPLFVRNAYRQARSWYEILRARNTNFLRFAPPGHFYSPIPDIQQLRIHAARVFHRADDGIPGVDLRPDAQLALLERFATYHAELPFPEQADSTCRYHLDNEWFSYGDSVVLYSMMRTFEPKRIVEVGSGFSSAAMLEVDDLFLNGRTDLTFIDPYPLRLQGLLTESDRSRCKLLATPVQDVDMDVFTSLTSDDILFIDSSHVAKTDSDVLHLFFQVLPRLAEGVIVHVHDIPWPFDYPVNWLEQGRAWNEAYLLRAFLQYNSAFEILYFNAFLEQKHPDALRASLPMAMRIPSQPNTCGNSSIWLRKIRSC